METEKVWLSWSYVLVMPSTRISYIKKSSICVILLFVLFDYTAECDGLAVSILLALALAMLGLAAWLVQEYCFSRISVPSSVSRYFRCEGTKSFRDKSRQLRNLFFLILYEMGMDDKDVHRIMGIPQEITRSTRYRIQQNVKK